MTRTRWIVLLALVLGQAWLNSTTFMSAPHNGGDNAGYVALGKALADGVGYVETWDPQTPAHTKYPPVFPLLLAVFIQLGATTWNALKMVAFLGSLVVTGATFLWASRRAGLAAGIGVSVLTGTSWSMMWHSSLVLSDVPFVAFTLLSLWSIDEVMRREDEGRSRVGFLWVAGASAFLAYFTRSAGLPLVVAILGSLLVRGHRRSALTLGGVVGVPAAIWFFRSLTAGSDEGRYAAEFLLLDPYDPGLGQAGIADFVDRLVGNTVTYLFEYVPTALTGSAEGLIVPVAVATVALAAAGWGMAVVRSRGPAEFFLPLYLGLILLWPTVWSGDRFILPLLPLLFLYAWEALHEAGRRIHAHAGTGAAVVLALGLLIPIAQGWRSEVEYADRCRAVIREIGPWGCSGRSTLAFALVSRWAGSNLEPGTVVLTRKPRIFHALSGLPSRTYPFEDDPRVLFDDAERLGAEYVILDAIGGAGLRYLGRAVIAHPERFCQVTGVGEGDPESQTVVLAIFGADDAAARERAFEEAGVEPRLVVCPEELRGRGERVPTFIGGSIPILTGELAGRPSG